MAAVDHYSTTPTHSSMADFPCNPFDLLDYVPFDECPMPAKTGKLPVQGLSSPVSDMTSQHSAVYVDSGSSGGNNTRSGASSSSSSEGRSGKGGASVIAFRTKSKVEIMDDGFKWRKYGKKSVKNSPNPRNYYRCSTEGCSVKKRVERDPKEASYVITTYEGIHNHASPDVVYYATHDRQSGRFVVSGWHPTTRSS